MCTHENLLTRATFVRYEYVTLGETSEQLWWLSEVSGENVGGVARNPLRQVDRRIDASVETDENARRVFPNVLNRVPISLRDVPNVPFLELLDPIPAVGTEQGHTHPTLDNVLPLVSSRMPVQLA